MEQPSNTPIANAYKQTLSKKEKDTINKNSDPKIKINTKTSLG